MNFFVLRSFKERFKIFVWPLTINRRSGGGGGGRGYCVYQREVVRELI